MIRHLALGMAFFLTLSFAGAAFSMHDGGHAHDVGVQGCILATLQGSAECPPTAAPLAVMSYHANAVKSIGLSIFFSIILALGAIIVLGLAQPTPPLARSSLQRAPILNTSPRYRYRSWLAHLEHSPTGI